MTKTRTIWEKLQILYSIKTEMRARKLFFWLGEEAYDYV